MKQPYHGPAAAPRPALVLPSRLALRRLSGALLLALGLATSPVWGQATRPGPDFFRADAAARTAAATSPLAATLAHARAQALTLDEPGLRAALATAPLEGRAGAAPLVLALPQPDGSSARFALREAPIMEAPLAARYPQIKTYAGVGLDDATATVRVDLTPRGFHAQVLSSSEPGFLIAPVSLTDTRHVLSYYRKDERPAVVGKAAGCGFVATPAQEKASTAQVAAWRAGGGSAQARATGAQLRTYRLALACTPEYALTKGNTTAGVLAAEVVTLNQVVGTFERELAVRLMLVANNDQITFLRGGTPPPVPYTNSDVETMLDENQPNVDGVIGSANYDIGFVFGTSRQGGIAGLGVLCLDGQKARGAGDDIVYIIRHEMGHQLGALHSFNTINGGRNDRSAWEPGSGITIMSYAGLYGPSDDAQPNVEEVFHTGSCEEIQAMMSRRGCGTLTATGNTPPVVTVPASGKTLPANTPFQLTATATDANGDPLTYSWEEVDRGPGGNLTMAQVTGQTPPLFRSWLPVTSGTRYFPGLAELVNNTAALGERLPTVTRKLRFRCTARDLHSGALGVVGGITSSDSLNLVVSAAAGPFVVTAPNAAGISWAGGSTQTVTWDVANTNTAPVSCAKVNLRLSLDGGLTYPTLLASNVDNSGSASITVPNAPTSTARMMVEAADNYFFDISNANFAITPPPPSGPSGPSVATLLRDCSFSGAAVTLPVGDFTLSQLQARGLFNDDVSSLGVSSGFEVVLFDGDNFQGESLTVVGNEPCLLGRNFNDRTSSVRVRPVSAATLYKHCGFGGYAVVLPAAGTYSLSQLQALGCLDDDISSLRVSSGVEVVLYEHDNLGGASLRVDANPECLISEGWNDRVSSVLVRNVASAPASAPTVAELVASMAAPLAVSVYPNPVSNRLTLTAATNLKGEQIRIVDQNGRQVWRGPYDGQAVDVSGLRPGTYMLVVLTPDRRKLSIRFSKQ